MIVCPDYDKLQKNTETDLELINTYGRQISIVDVELCEIILRHLKKMVDTVVYDMLNTKLQHKYEEALFEVAKACYKLNNVIMTEEVPSWYVKENHVEGHPFMDRSEVTEMLENLIKNDLYRFDDGFYFEIENDQPNMKKLKNENKS